MLLGLYNSDFFEVCQLLVLLVNLRTQTGNGLLDISVIVLTEFGNNARLEQGLFESEALFLLGDQQALIILPLTDFIFEPIT